MLEGGNEQLQKYFEVLKIEKAPIEKLYLLRASGHYREKLKEKVCFAQLDKGLIETPLSKEKKTASPSSRASGPSHYKHICADFSEGPLGLTLSASNDSRAVVSKVVSGSHADRTGILPGDIVVRIAGKAAINYDDIMDSLPFYARPMRVDFARRMEDTPQRRMSRNLSWDPAPSRIADGELGDLSTSMHALVLGHGDSVNSSFDREDVHALGDGCATRVRLEFSPERQINEEPMRVLISAPTIVSTSPDLDYDDWVRYFSSSFSRDVDVVIPARPIGLTLAMNSEGAAEVTAVVSGGHADLHGILVGDIVVCVNQIEQLSYDPVVAAITSSMFPLQITFRRVTNASNFLEDKVSIGDVSSDQDYIVSAVIESLPRYMCFILNYISVIFV